MASSIKRITDLDIGCYGVGVGITGSSDVYINSLNSQRVSDLCVGPGVGVCVTGSTDIFINSLSQHRVADIVMYSCGPHISITGSMDAFTD